MASFKYQRIKDAILEMIRKGRFRSGAKLPSEQELATRFGVNYHTVRKALSILVEEGRIERRVGSGTFLKISTSGSVKASRSAKTGNAIGALIQAGYSESAMRFVERLQQATEAAGKVLNLRATQEFGARALEQIIELASQGCCSVIIPYLKSDTDINALATMVRASPLEIVLPDLIPGFERNVCDAPEIFGNGDTDAVEVLVDYLLRLGLRRVAFLGPDRRRNLALQRKSFAFSRYAGLRAVENTVGLVGSASDDVDRMVDNWHRDGSPVGVICSDVAMALRLLTSLHRKGIDVPAAFAITAMGEGPGTVSADPPLTTIDYNHRDSADAMVAHALALARGKTAQSRTGPRINMIVRESCGGTRLGGKKLTSLLSKLAITGGFTIDAARNATAAR